jgi:hypothetical protein
MHNVAEGSSVAFFGEREEAVTDEGDEIHDEKQQISERDKLVDTAEIDDQEPKTEKVDEAAVDACENQDFVPDRRRF